MAYVNKPGDSDATPEERVDAAYQQALIDSQWPMGVQPGDQPPAGSGGGGGTGQYVFADLQHLDGVLNDWKTLRDRIRDRSGKIRQAMRLCNPPAFDEMSVMQAQATKDSLQKAFDHNEAMYAYADRYVTNLQATRDSMAATDDSNADTIRKASS